MAKDKKINPEKQKIQSFLMHYLEKKAHQMYGWNQQEFADRAFGATKDNPLSYRNKLFRGYWSKPKGTETGRWVSTWLELPDLFDLAKVFNMDLGTLINEVLAVMHHTKATHPEDLEEIFKKVPSLKGK